MIERSIGAGVVVAAVVAAVVACSGSSKFKPSEPNWGSGSSGGSASLGSSSDASGGSGASGGSDAPGGSGASGGSSASGAGSGASGGSGASSGSGVSRGSGASTWLADLQCRDNNCAGQGSDCTPSAPFVMLTTHQCGGIPQPQPTREASERYKRDRAAGIKAKTWPCECHCLAADQAEMRDCMMRP